jgi:hypothetical protein
MEDQLLVLLLEDPEVLEAVLAVLVVVVVEREILHL